MTTAARCAGATAPSSTAVFSFDFANGPQDWQPGFAEYQAGQESFMELTADYRPLPASLGNGMAWFISGINHSDDLFMFLKRRVVGLKARAVYALQIEVQIATDVPTGCGGVGDLQGNRCS